MREGCSASRQREETSIPAMGVGTRLGNQLKAPLLPSHDGLHDRMQGDCLDTIVWEAQRWG